MNILFKRVFMIFFALFIFVSNGVAQEAPSDSDVDFLNWSFLATIQKANAEDLDYVASRLESRLIDVNTTDEFGRNALMLAANNGSDGRIPMLKLLIAEGIDMNAQDEDGRTALSYHGNYDEGELSEEQELLIEAGAQWSDADRESFSDSHDKVLPLYREITASRSYKTSLHDRVLPLIERLQLQDHIKRPLIERLQPQDHITSLHNRVLPLIERLQPQDHITSLHNRVLPLIERRNPLKMRVIILPNGG